MGRKKAYQAILAGLLTALTVLLCAAAVRIWQEGSARKAESPLEAVYTADIAAEELLRISPLLLAVIGMAAAGPILGIRDEHSARPVSSPEAERDLLASRLGAPGEEIRRERKKQRILRWIRWAAFVACMVPILIYCTDRGHFPEKDLEGMIASLMLHAAPWAAAGLLILLGGTVLETRSIRREIDAARAQLQAEKGRGQADAGNPSALAQPQAKKNGQRAAVPAEKRPAGGTAAVRIALLLAAAVLIVLGALNGSLQDVLLKAINICTECIGLG